MAASIKAVKVYIKVSVVFDEDGQMLPRAFEWEDGRKYKIDRVLKKRPAHADKVGGQGDRFTIKVTEENNDQTFAKWLVKSGNAEISSLYSATAVVTAGAGDCEIEAVYSLTELGQLRAENEALKAENAALKGESRIPGDINGDGKVNISDVVRLAQYVKARGKGVEIH